MAIPLMVNFLEDLLNFGMLPSNHRQIESEDKLQSYGDWILKDMAVPTLENFLEDSQAC